MAYCWPCSMQDIGLDTSTMGRSSRQDSGVVDRQTTRTRVIMTRRSPEKCSPVPVATKTSRRLAAGCGVWEGYCNDHAIEWAGWWADLRMGEPPAATKL